MGHSWRDLGYLMATGVVGEVALWIWVGARRFGHVAKPVTL